MMTLSLRQAYKILRINRESHRESNSEINSEANSEVEIDLDRAYNKMIYRYPASLFPQKFREIQEAYSFLKNKDDFWKDLLESEHPNVEGLWQEWIKEPVVEIREKMELQLTEQQIMDLELKPKLETEKEFLSQTLPPFLRHTLFDNL